MEIDRKIFARGVGLQINQSWVCTLNSDVILMVIFRDYVYVGNFLLKPFFFPFIPGLV